MGAKINLFKKKFYSFQMKYSYFSYFRHLRQLAGLLREQETQFKFQNKEIFVRSFVGAMLDLIRKAGVFFLLTSI